MEPLIMGLGCFSVKPASTERPAYIAAHLCKSGFHTLHLLLWAFDLTADVLALLVGTALGKDELGRFEARLVRLSVLHCERFSSRSRYDRELKAVDVNVRS